MHFGLEIPKPRLIEREYVLAGGLRSKMHVRVRLEQHDFVCVLNQKHQNVGMVSAQVQMHDTLVVQQRVLVGVDAGAILRLSHTLSALDGFNQIVQLRAQDGILADLREVLELNDVDRLWPVLQAWQAQPERRVTRLQSP